MARPAMFSDDQILDAALELVAASRPSAATIAAISGAIGLVACGFSVVQQLLGIEQTAVPGITRAVGVDYSAKPLLFAGAARSRARTRTATSSVSSPDFSSWSPPNGSWAAAGDVGTA